MILAKLHIFTISISIFLLILLFINRLINYNRTLTTPMTTTTNKPKVLRPIRNTNSIENQFYWGNGEINSM